MAKPNIIIVLADDMGYGDSSAYDGWINTPHMETMAREGLKFTDFHSSGHVCSPTRAGLLTGRYQQRAGIPNVVYAPPNNPEHYAGLYPSEITFPKLLKEVGYTSAIFGKWHLGYYKKFNPLHHGFDRFRGYVSGNVDYISHYDGVENYDWWEGLEHIEEEGYTTHLITKHSVQFIKDHKDTPFCLYVAHEAVHTPLQGPDDPAIRGPKKEDFHPDDPKETYRQMMKEMDDSLGEIMATVKEEGIAENTLVIFFSDNGGTPQNPESNAPLRGNKGTVWEGGHRVPAIAWWPGTIAPNTVTDQLAISLDLFPTMCDLSGASKPDNHFDGISLKSLLLGENEPGSRHLFWNGLAMRDDNWKLVIDNDTPCLFDLSQDIAESNDLSAHQPDRVKSMCEAINTWKADVDDGATPQPGRDVKINA
ncbi:MAG: sulfatase-like hydrolase/transferase [Candidatus Latescibacteria bacterium]|nr:sulfatase-like hydrolase/transferase [Candidatus Latescibacterota bacterium]